MSRSRTRVGKNPVSLFPFLAVLLCTMGSLILLLIVISRSARARSLESIDDPDSVVVTQDLEAERELLELKIAQLTEQRARTEEDLRGRQLELGHLEAAAQKLRVELEEMVRAAEQLRHDETLDANARWRLQFELERKQGEIARKRLELDQLRKWLASQPVSYAVVPYVGPNGTRRPPIYFECRADAIILQPEGIRLTEEDFEGPLGPGNPLAAAMRAVREHLARKRHSNAGPTGEPYPMLLVRPDGIAAYWVAREALQSWGADFGYELIDADWEVAYTAPDKELAQQVEQAVQAARQQQVLLAQLAPRSFGRSARVFRANPGGGGIIEEGAPRHESRERHPRRVRNPYADGFAAGGGDGTNPAGSRDGAEVDRAPFYPPEASPGDGHDPGAPPAGSRFAASGSEPGERRNHADSSREMERWGDNDQPFASGNDQPLGARSGMSAKGAPRQSGSTGMTSPLDTSGRGGSSQVSSAGGPHSFDYQTAPHLRSLAEKRGKNWGLPEAARGASPVTRPILLECRRESIALLADDGSRRPASVVPLQQRTEDSIDELMAAVWKHIESWGIAGNGMYWHPLLVVDVLPGSEFRADELEALLAGSGIEVKRRGQAAITQAPLPARQR